MVTTAFTILHLSDVHFGVSDPEHEQPRITNALINAVNEYQGQIDYCIFTGDLSFSAQSKQFLEAEKWLEKVYRSIGNTNAKMFICPGNHDSDRNAAIHFIIESSSINLNTFLGYKNRNWDNSNHLKEFKRWHKSFQVKHDWVVSEWSKNVNLVKARHSGLNINFILANSALLSCSNNDRGHLCVDYPELNKCLSECDSNSELIVYAMHHPLDDKWFSEWNEKELRTLLNQKVGCHISLTGHIHDPKAKGFSNLYGQSLVELSGGAAYAGSKWPQAFSIWNIKPEEKKITPTTFRYHKKPGQWIIDNALSNEILLNLPDGINATLGNKTKHKTKQSNIFQKPKKTDILNFFSLKLNNTDVIDISVDKAIFIDKNSDSGSYYKQFETAIWLPKGEVIESINGSHYVSAVAFSFPSIDMFTNNLSKYFSTDDIKQLNNNNFKKIPKATKEKVVNMITDYADKGFIVTVSLPQIIFDSTGKNTKAKNAMYGLINTLLSTTLKAKTHAEFDSINIYINNHASLNNGIRKRISSITRKTLPTNTKVTNNVFSDEDEVITLEKIMGLVSWFVMQSDNTGVDYWMKKVKNNT